MKRKEGTLLKPELRISFGSIKFFLYWFFTTFIAQSNDSQTLGWKREEKVAALARSKNGKQVVVLVFVVLLVTAKM